MGHGARAALRNHVDDTASGVGVLGAEVAGLDAELLHLFHLRAILRNIKRKVRIIPAIEHELVLIGPRTVNGEELVMAFEHGIDRCLPRRADSGNQHHQGIRVTTQ